MRVELPRESSFVGRAAKCERPRLFLRPLRPLIESARNRRGLSPRVVLQRNAARCSDKGANGVGALGLVVPVAHIERTAKHRANSTPAALGIVACTDINNHRNSKVRVEREERLFIGPRISVSALSQRHVIPIFVTR